MHLHFESDREGVLKSFGKSESDLQNYKDVINKWIEQQPHLPKPQDNKLEVMIIGSKFSLETTKRKIEKYYTVRNIEQSFFGNWDVLDPRLQQAFNTYACLPMTKLTKERHQVLVFRALDTNPDHFDLVDFIRIFFIISEKLYPDLYVAGHQVVFDFGHFTLPYLKHVSPAVLQKLIVIGTEAFAYRFKAFHVVNATPVVDTFLSIVKLIMKPKLYNRFKLHKNYESLHEAVPLECLPKEYGGTAGEYNELLGLFLKDLEDSRQHFIDETKIKTDESKRIGKLNTDEFYGSIHGSFRKLQVD